MKKTQGYQEVMGPVEARGGEIAPGLGGRRSPGRPGESGASGGPKMRKQKAGVPAGRGNR